MLSECRVRIVERASGRLIDGMVRPARVSDKVFWTRWHAHMPPDAEDTHWEWDDLIDLARAMPDRFEAYALETAENLEGLRLLEISESEVEQYGVHALRLSVAPWNRPPKRRHTGVGSVLVAIAILRSVELGYRGRIHCESLPGAEEFHERNGMIRLDEISNEGLRRFYFTEPGAALFLTRLRDEGLLL